jgi:hypothetical protein
MTSLLVAIAEYDGERQLVAMLGERWNWGANLRTAQG